MSEEDDTEREYEKREGGEWHLCANMRFSICVCVCVFVGVIGDQIKKRKKYLAPCPFEVRTLDLAFISLIGDSLSLLWILKLV